MTIREQLENESSARDVVFKTALEYLNKEEASIYEIGCLRDLRSRDRRDYLPCVKRRK